MIGAFIVGKRLINSRGEDWQVTATTSGGSPLDCQLEDRSIKVQRESVGTIVKNEFHPGLGVTVAGSAGQVVLSNGLRVEIEAQRRTIFLAFRAKGGGTPSSAPATPPVLRRR